MNHKEKVKLAKKLNTFVDKKGVPHTPQTNLMMNNRRWDKHREVVAQRVAKREERIKLGVQKKKEAKNASK